MGVGIQNYEVMKKLGRGAQGIVFCVQDKRDENQKYVLKKIECNDESEANSAFKEIMALQRLEHKNICGLRDFFIVWDKQVETIYVCIVMTLYTQGDLHVALNKRRKRGDGLSELEIMGYFGDLCSALGYVHNQGFIHRDLKPSNLFLTDSGELHLGDFGVSTVLEGQAKTCTGTMEFLAPEVLERPYDARSDVWSLGCILLEMATVGFMDHRENSEMLFEVKKSPQRLDEVLGRLRKEGYSKNLCHVIRTILRRNFEQRPTIEELAQLPWVRETLKMSRRGSDDDEQEDAAVAPSAGSRPGSARAAKGRVGGGVTPPRLGSTGRRGSSKVAESSFAADFRGKAAGDAVEMIEARAGNPAFVCAGLKRLLELTVTKDKDKDKSGEAAAADGGPNPKSKPKPSGGIDLPKTTVRAILAAMGKHVDNGRLQALSSHVLRNVTTRAKPGDEVFGKAVLDRVLTALRANPGDEAYQKEGCALLWAMSTDDACAARIGARGGIQDILSALRMYPENPSIAQACCSALWSLTVNEDNAKIVKEERGVVDVLGALRTHGTCVPVLEATCAALWSLSVDDDNIETIAEAGGVGAVVAALQAHIEEPKVVMQACMALASLCVDEVCAVAVWDNEEGVNGLAVLAQVLRAHKGNSEVAENACVFVAELAEHDDLLEEMRKQKVDKAIAALAEFFEEHEGIDDVKTAIQTALGHFTDEEC